jgi:hypothetical protein
MRASLLLLLVLAGCANSNNPRYANCAALVNSDPEIRDLMAKYAGSATFYQQSQFDPTPLRNAKMQACLHGSSINTGVEPVRRPNVTFDLF